MRDAPGDGGHGPAALITPLRSSLRSSFVEIELRHVLTERHRPVQLVDCKLDDGRPDRGLRYLKARYPEAEARQVSAVGGDNFRTPAGIRVCPAVEFLKSLV